MAEQSLNDKTVSGVAWSGIDNVVQFGVSFIISIILARLLSPDDYGLLGIIAIFTVVCNTLINAGFNSALIRKKDYTNDDYNKWLPRLRFSSNSFHELFGFGWKLMLSGLIDTIWKELYQVVVGKFYSPAALGQYTRAKQFSTMFSSNLTSIIQRVFYPVLSTIQDDRERMVSVYRRIIKITIFVTAISMFFLGAISEPLLYCLIGPKWNEAAIFLPLICISGSLYPLHAINLNMLAVQGRSDLCLGIEVAKK